MMVRAVVFLVIIGSASIAAAQNAETSLVCQGTDPQWVLQTTPQGASFDFQYASELTLQLTTLAEGADWPRAYTFIGRGDSAIVIIEPAQPNGRHPARILTQRGETPLLLTGFCNVG